MLQEARAQEYRTFVLRLRGRLTCTIDDAAGPPGFRPFSIEARSPAQYLLEGDPRSGDRAQPSEGPLRRSAVRPARRQAQIDVVILSTAAGAKSFLQSAATPCQNCDKWVCLLWRSEPLLKEQVYYAESVAQMLQRW